MDLIPKLGDKLAHKSNKNQCFGESWRQLGGDLWGSWEGLGAILATKRVPTGFLMFLVGWGVQLGAQVGSNLGGLGPTLGHLGSKLGGLGPILAPSWGVLGRLGLHVGRFWPLCWGHVEHHVVSCSI